MSSLLPARTFAQPDQIKDTSLGFTVSPTIIDFGADPGNKIFRAMRITNNSGQIVPVTMSVKSLLYSSVEISESERHSFDASKWIALSGNNYIFNPYETKEISVVAAVPDTASPGGHYAQIDIQPLYLSSDKQENSVSIMPELTAAVFLTVSGDTSEQLDAVIDSSVPRFMISGTEETLMFNVANSGTIHSLTQPKLIVSKNHQIIHEVILSPQIILPNTIKTLSTNWKIPNNYGMYEVQLLFTYGSGTNKTEVMSVPHKIIIMPQIGYVLATGGLLAVIIFIAMKRRNIWPALRIILNKNE